MQSITRPSSRASPAHGQEGKWIVNMLDLVVLVIFGVASALTYLLVKGCESLMEKHP